jgi:ribosomal protein L7/L12
MAEIFNCPTCGGPLEYTGEQGPTVRCRYCFNTVIVPEELRRSQQPEGSVSDQVQSRTMALPILAPLVDPQLLETEIHELLANGQKIGAIKLYRQATRAGLKDAKDAVEAIESGGSLDPSQLFQPSGLPPLSVDHAETFDRVTQLIHAGKKIDAIKLLREQYDVSLKVAKDAVDGLEQGQPVDIEWLKLSASRDASPAVKLPPRKQGQGTNMFIPLGCVLIILLVVVFILFTVFFPMLVR